jgi:RND family efflux transporter MFP subunit
LRGYEETIIYARTSGYVSSWLKTIGDRVRKGELLATLSAPEQEQELIQARAVREQVKARADLTAASLVRWEAQHQYHVISEQDFEEKRSADRQARADLAAADANVRRLEQLLALQRIVAPFDGIVIRRSIDVGMLVSPGTKELFALSQTTRLRLTVWVPQAYANNVQVGQPVDIKINETEHRSFAGSIEHVSGGIDTGTNARQVEVIVPNDNDELLPGSYANVHLSVMHSTKSLLVSPNALLLGKDGPRVIVVRDGNRLSYRSVELGRDFGKEIEVLAGIAREDAIVVNPSQLLQEDEIVDVRSADGRATVPAVSSSIPSPVRSAGS